MQQSNANPSTFNAIGSQHQRRLDQYGWTNGQNANGTHIPTTSGAQSTATHMGTSSYNYSANGAVAKTNNPNSNLSTVGITARGSTAPYVHPTPSARQPNATAHNNMDDSSHQNQVVDLAHKVIDSLGNQSDVPELVPFCEHEIPCASLCVSKKFKPDGSPNPNVGRYFWACANPQESRCNFFEWQDGKPSLYKKADTPTLSAELVGTLKERMDSLEANVTAVSFIFYIYLY